MVSVGDAKFILSEIRQINYYETKIGELMGRLSDMDMMIADVTSPVSPQGGQDVKVKGKTVRVKVHGAGMNSSQRIVELATAKKPIEDMLTDFRKRHIRALDYRRQLMHSKHAEYINDFFSGMSYKDIQRKYYVSNAYDKTLRIIVSTIKTI